MILFSFGELLSHCPGISHITQNADFPLPATQI
jgi:hypothetical protein